MMIVTVQIQDTKMGRRRISALSPPRFLIVTYSIAVAVATVTASGLATMTKHVDGSVEYALGEICVVVFVLFRAAEQNQLSSTNAAIGLPNVTRIPTRYQDLYPCADSTWVPVLCI